VVRVLQTIMNGKTLFAVIACILFAFAATSCWDTDNPIRAGQNGPGVPSRPGHNVNLGGKLHATGYCEPFLHCTACHGDSLKGGPVGQPSCTKCHLDHWNAPNCGVATHTINLGGYLHAPGYCQPYRNCAQCHGSDLTGGTAGQPSCTKCHVDHWSGPNCGVNIHTINLGGHLHAPNYCLPLQNCTQCHGSDLRGGTARQPSCYSCHNDQWSGGECGD
jgi:hypothetical protein